METEDGRQSRDAIGAGDREFVEGSIEVVVVPPVTSAFRARLEDSLQEITDLRLVTAGGSFEGGIRMIAFAGRPLPLVAILGRLPFVSQVDTQRVKGVTRLRVRLAAPG